MRFRCLFILSALLCSAAAWGSDAVVKIEGLVREKGTRKPLAQVNFYCFLPDHPEKPPIKATTDQDGHFSMDVPEGKLKWVASVPNYVRLENQDEQWAAKENPLREFFLEKSSYLTYETTVYGQDDKRDEKTKSLDQAQFLTVPGANGDPVKAVQNLPGVNRASAFSSQVIIEGSAPSDTRYDIDNQNVPIIFHFGGLSSVVMPEAVDHVDYLSAGFGPEFGQSTAGLVNLAVKDPQTDRVHGFVYADFLNAGGMVEGPINDHSSFLFGVRQSYIGFVLGAAVGATNSAFQLTAVPDFRDTVLEYRNQITPVDTFRIIGVGSQDTLGFLLSQPAGQDPSIRGNFNEDSEFFRIIPEWTHKFSTDVTGRVSLGIGKDWTDLNIGTIFSDTNDSVVTGRAEIEDQITPGWKSYWGIDTQTYLSNISFEVPVDTYNSIGGSDLRSVSNVYTTNAAGFYWRNTITPTDSPWTLMPSARLSYYSFTSEWMPEPRVAAKYAAGKGWTLRAATGLYDEAPPIRDMDAIYGNPNLTSQRAVHATVGFEKDFRDGSATGWTLTDDLFYKYLYNLVAESTAFVTPSQPQYYNNSGYGHIIGMEVLAKYKTSAWEGWISYTLSRSTIGDDEDAEALSNYDQTHLLTAVGDVELGRNWKFSARVRYTTGDPYTPITGGILDIDNDSYSPITGTLNSSRLNPFFEVDVRFDKKWIFDRWILTAYLDIENVTNQKNPEEVNYNYDYSQSAIITGLPFLPTLGLKAEL